MIFEKIKDVIIKTCLSVENPIVTSMGGTKYKTTCFELYGFDVLIDSNFKPWLLEVNVSPSLSSSSPMDKYIKTLLLSDSFYLTGMNIFDRKQLEKDKSKNDKQRLLGFDSTKNVHQVTAGLGEPTLMSNQNSTNSNEIGSPQIKFADLSGNKLSKQLSSSTKKQKQPKLPLYQMKPGQSMWLKDLEPLDGSSPGSGGGATQVMPTESGYLITAEHDLEGLVQYEEERERRGHFSLIFPLKTNIDSYRPYFS